MLDFLKPNRAPRYITILQFVEITKLSFLEYNELYQEGKIEIMRKDGESFVDLEAMAALVAQEKNDNVQ
jgi:hypothetical protein